ncbi:MAG: hypothetical protein K2I44_00140, partial [Muribaculaceae bacterium]|nr:hypothetical protein [Muribaculaceae bacterium]
DFNKRIEEIRYVLQAHYYELQKANGHVTAEMVKNAYMGITAKAESLMPIYDEMLWGSVRYVQFVVYIVRNSV